MKSKNTYWGVVILDVAIILLAGTTSIYQNNTAYLWLLVLMFCTGSSKVEK